MLTLADRVAYQRAIEEVYWRHRIWPKERPDPKPSLDEVMPPEQLEKKVEDYLRNSQALEDYWKEPLSAEQLQAEMERMAQHTKQPEVLRELFEALGNDPYVIAECLARSALSERLVTNFYAYDQRFHGELKQRAEADLRAHHRVKQMRQTSGKYSEIELVKSDSVQDQDSRRTEPDLKLNSHDWDENVQKLAAMFGDAPATQIKTGVVSSLQEDEDRYYATAVLKKSNDHVKLATIEWRKEPFESWKAGAESQLPKVMAAVTANYTLPTISDGTNGCTDDTWTNTTGLPDERYLHTAVWTGSEMIVWGGISGVSGTLLDSGARYNPITDSWLAMSTTNAPSARSGHTAVWTGSEMIVWGGLDSLPYGGERVNTGGRYDPSTDGWTATSTANAPSGRSSHTAVWNGNEMIVWGGDFGGMFTNTGGRYNPSTDSWAATTTANAPLSRISHTAVWTGSEMIVWGGSLLNTGGRYNPSTDSWAATSTTNAPTGRYSHTAVWTGTEMIVWGGNALSGFLNSGGRYNPSADSWIATSTTNAPSAREYHTAVWTGSEMIVWGGDELYPPYFNTGSRYNPSTDSWIATSTTNAPSARDYHTAVWTGSEMIVWGGMSNSGTLNTGGRYNPSADSWVATTTYNPPSPRESHTAVWTGNEMIVWGGFDGLNYLNTGGRYNPGTDSWTATSTTNAPSARDYHTAVWTGTEMIVWGGYEGRAFDVNTGSRYNPSTDSWIDTTLTNAPLDESHTPQFGRAVK
jgi:N-acetylneuraminic acid mutarotase